MPNPNIIAVLKEAWSRDAGLEKRILDLSCGGGDTSRMLPSHDFQVIATEIGIPPAMDGLVHRVGGVDLNRHLPFKSAAFDGVNLGNSINPTEDQPLLVREIARVLKKGGVVLIGTPNVVNVLSRLRFLIRGFLGGRVLSVHYTLKDSNCLVHSYQLYDQLFNNGFEIEELKKTNIKFARVFFGIFLYPLMWILSVGIVIRSEKDLAQRAQNWKILRHLLHSANLFSDYVVIGARKRDDEQIAASLLSARAETRERVYRDIYEREYEMEAEHMTRLPSARRSKRIQLYKTAIGKGHERILEVGCGSGDLTYALMSQGKRVFGTDISAAALHLARSRKSLWKLQEQDVHRVQFLEMNATHLAFDNESFDRIVSTSVIEHLHPDDVPSHFKEVWRVLKPSGKYLIWCPNGLGQHKDRDFHLSMCSYREWIAKMKAAGFQDFRSPLFNRPPFVDARFKVFCESALFHLGISVLWSHLGVRNVLLVARKRSRGN